MDKFAGVFELKNKLRGNWQTLFALSFIILLSAVAFSPVLDNGFTNWDDPFYVTQNPYITKLSAENVKTFFTTDIAFNYHPLTMLSLAVDYQLSHFDANGQIAAGAFHRTNLLLHLFNVTLVFWFTLLLAKGKKEIAIIAALLFSIHPMHVETVAWVSERKDVLYAFFFLAGLVAYLYYLGRQLKPGYLLLAFGLFLLSCLSKPTAVLFPVVLLLLDFYVRRKWSLRIAIEKIPFVVLSVIFGLKTIGIQSGATIGNWSDYGLLERTMFACYGAVAYLGKLFYPVHLTAHYAYPEKGALPLVYYLAPFLLLALSGFVAYSLKKTRVFAFGFLFYLLMNALTIQFVSVGSSIISERYSYLPYVGLYFVIGWLGAMVMQRIKNPATEKALLLGAGVCCVFLVLRTYKQCEVWESSETLWANAIAVAPGDYKGYSGMADHYLKKKGEAEKAVVYLDKAIELGHGGAVDAYINRAWTRRDSKEYVKALEDSNMAVKLSGGSVSALNCRGNIYFAMKQYDKAIADFEGALDASGGRSYLAIGNLGAVCLDQKKFGKSLVHLSRALDIYPNFTNARLNRAFAHSGLGKAKLAVQDYDKYLALVPRHVEAHYWQALEKIKLGMLPSALESLGKAIRLKPTAGYLYQSRAEVHRKMGDGQAADADIRAISELQ